ncbi:MAG: alpha/beta fold hydrolase, partial [Candidatus Aminicenantes bacterium]|nr:alpha/beta fold hydrolase [Candidatus Aminicenantes bacterium]
MNKNSAASIVAAAALFLLARQAGESQAQQVRLWPNIQPFRTGELQVSDLHRIYFEMSGNRGGKPVVVLHGGPGAKSSPYYRRFFNPEKFLIVQFDQRGCGLSKPLFELRENTTPDLVADIEKLRLHLELGKILIFGGSWGSTLALAYAEEHPAATAGLILRGIFTGTREELDHYYRGVRFFFPEAYDKLRDALGRTPSPQAVLKLLQGGNEEVRRNIERAWVEFEFKIAELQTRDSEIQRTLDAPALADTIRSLALIENHYMANRCFLE